MNADNNKTNGKLKTLTSSKVVILYFALATAWILGSGYLIEFTTEEPSLRAQLELSKGMLFVIFTSGLLYVLLKTWRTQQSSNEVQTSDRVFKTTGILLLFLGLVLSVPLLSFAIAKYYEPKIEQEAYENLAAVTQLKGIQIEDWLNERHADASTLSDSTTEFVRSVRRMVTSGDVAAADYVRGKLASYRVSYHYDSLLVFDSELNLELAEGENTAVDEYLADVIAQVFAQGLVRNTDLYISQDGHTHMDWVVPIFDVASNEQDVVAVVIMRTSPDQFLYPLIRTWPGATETAETMLVRQEGDSVVYLNNLKLRDSSALTLKLPMSTEKLTAAVALRENQAGFVEGVDYVGNRVLTAYQPVAGSNWHLVTKIDRDEVFHDLFKGLILVTAIASIFVLIVALTLLMIWRQQTRLQELKAEAHKNEADRLLSHFFTMPFVGMAVISPDHKTITECNDYLCEITGYTKEELVGHSCLGFTHDEDIPADIAEFERVLSGEISSYIMEKRFHHKDGHILHAMVDTKCVRKEDGSVDYLFATAEDITERKVAEARIQRLTQLYAALSACNKSIVRCKSEAELFQQICQLTVQEGGMKMVWVGLINPANRMVEPAASYGDDWGYLKNIKISCDAKSVYGKGPVGTALRQNEPYWCQDFMNDPITLKWRERSKGVWGSSAAVPICRGGNVVGAFSLYSEVKHAFDHDARKLLMEMAQDIGFALDNFDREARRSLAESKLGESENKFHMLFDQSLDGLLVIDNEEIVECNSTVLSMMGCGAEHIIHIPVWTFSPDKQPDGMPSDKKMRAMLEIARLEGRHRFEWVLRRLNGEEFPAEVSMVMITLDGHKVFYTTWRDISEQRSAEAQIRHLAQYDVLTNLPNRTLLTDRVNQAINIAQRNHQHLSLMFFDLDRFKTVNDTMGHSVGDQLLIQVSNRLQKVIREQDTVSRLGGDEFVLMLFDTNVDGAARVAEKLMHSIALPYRIGEYELLITPSIGIAVYPEDGLDFEALLQSADIAMYRAKQAGRNNYHFFTVKMQEDSIRTMQLTAALRQAVELGQLSINYQPQQSLKDGSIVGVEALLRWQHPEFGVVSPAEFIPVAEDSGEILKIGERVLQQSIRQLKQWQDQGLPIRNIAVNLSAAQFRQPHLPDLVSVLLEEEGLAPECLELELTESVSMDDPLAVIAMMDKLAELGVKMSIDDFGTGYSSLNHLKRFKVSKLKIDQTFVRDIMTDVDDRAIVKTIITLSKSLGIKTIAEGVETQEQLDFLKKCKCDEIQGYFFSKPLSAEEMATFYQKHHS